MKLIYIITLSILLIANVYSGDTKFGLTDKSLGNLQPAYTASGMGRSYEVAHSDSIMLNYKNLAIWTNISKTTVSVSAGYNATRSKNNKEISFFDNANFNGVAIAIPLLKQELTFGTALIPFTSIDQRFTSSLIENNEQLKQDIYISGGISRALFSLSYKLHEKISVGLGYEYTFGKITENVNRTLNDDLDSKINLKYENQYAANGIIISVFSSPINNLNLGLSYRPGVSGTITEKAFTPSINLNKEIEYDFSMPSEYNLGLEYKITDRDFVGLDYTTQNWEKEYKVNDKIVPFHNPYTYLGLGYEKKGKNRRFIKYSAQIDYRAGVFYKTLAHNYNGNSVTEIGASAGVTLPLTRFQSKIDVALFGGKRGDLTKNKLEELFFGLNLTISANEQWFVNIED